MSKCKRCRHERFCKKPYNCSEEVQRQVFGKTVTKEEWDKEDYCAGFEEQKESEVTMKMTKIDTARKIIEQGNCMGISCKNCFTTRKECWDTAGNHRMIHLAEAYEKRYARPKVKTTIKIGEVKAGVLKQEDIDKAKQDHIPDTTKKVEYVRCVNNENVPLTAGKIYEVVEESDVGFAVVDDVGEKREYYKDRFEPAEKPVEPVVKENFTPEPIKLILPNVFYCPMPDRMEVFHKNKLTDFACFKITPEGKILYSETSGNYACYLRVADAIEIGQKWWGKQ